MEKIKLKSKKFVFRVLLLAIGLFILSTAVYDRDGTRWISPGEYEVKVDRLTLGLPYWLKVNSFTSTSEPSFGFRVLPDIEKYPSGVHLNWKMLTVNVLICLVLAFGLNVLLRKKKLALIWPYLAVGLYSLGFDLWIVFGPHNNSFGWVGFVAYLILMLVIGWFALTFSNIAGIGLFGALSFWWWLRTLDHCLEKHMVRDFEIDENVLVVIIYGVLFTLVGCVTLSISKRINKRKKQEKLLVGQDGQVSDL